MKKLQFLGPVTNRKEDWSLPKGSKRVALLAYLDWPSRGAITGEINCWLYYGREQGRKVQEIH